LLAEVESEKIITKIRNILAPSKKENKSYQNHDFSTRELMLISEQVLKKTWENESDDEWAQYLKV
jgi:hypothetical protein